MNRNCNERHKWTEKKHGERERKYTSTDAPEFFVHFVEYNKQINT